MQLIASRLGNGLLQKKPKPKPSALLGRNPSKLLREAGVTLFLFGVSWPELKALVLREAACTG